MSHRSFMELLSDTRGRRSTGISIPRWMSRIRLATGPAFGCPSADGSTGFGTTRNTKHAMTTVYRTVIPSFNGPRTTSSQTSRCCDNMNPAMAAIPTSAPG
ncbi:unnamed protein product [Prorocentrum cordatum]|uniref:Uncharacterized protein n=1 Tax=Prorocentrum cordatum TaxID=2364126 RepID=A0ABN9QGK5_9DINO|nr:unnamed protein product [Polarella glacialis]